MEIAHLGGGDSDGPDAYDDDVPRCELSNFPLHDIARTISLCLQQDDIESLPSKTRKSQGVFDLKHLGDTYGSLLKQNFGMGSAFITVDARGFGKRHQHVVGLQKGDRSFG